MDFLTGFFQAHPECSRLTLFVSDQITKHVAGDNVLITTPDDSVLQTAFEKRMRALGPDFARFANWSFWDYEENCEESREICDSIRSEADAQTGYESKTQEQAMADLKTFLRANSSITDLSIHMDNWTTHLVEFTEIITERDQITTISLSSVGNLEDTVSKLPWICHMLETKPLITKLRLGAGMFRDPAGGGSDGLRLLQTFARSLAKTNHVHEVDFALDGMLTGCEEMRAKTETAAEAVLDLLLGPTSLTRLMFHMPRMQISPQLQKRLADAVAWHNSLIETDVTMWLCSDLVVKTVIPCSQLQSLSVCCSRGDSFHDRYVVQGMYGAVIAQPCITNIRFAPCPCLSSPGGYNGLFDVLTKRRNDC